MKSTVDGVLAASATALAGALLLFGIAAIRAVRADAARIEVEPALITPVSLTDSPSEASDLWTVTTGAVGAAADSDPFRADRQRPPQPYRIGGIPEPMPDSVPDLELPIAPPAPAFRLLGTVATTGGGLAVIEVPGVGTRVVAVGSSIGGYHLAAVGGGTATMMVGEFQHVLRVASPAPQAATPAPPAAISAPPESVRRQRPVDGARPARVHFQDGALQRLFEQAQERARQQNPQGGARAGGGNGQQRNGGQH